MLPRRRNRHTRHTSEIWRRETRASGCTWRRERKTTGWREGEAVGGDGRHSVGTGGEGGHGGHAATAGGCWNIGISIYVREEGGQKMRMRTYVGGLGGIGREELQAYRGMAEGCLIKYPC